MATQKTISYQQLGKLKSKLGDTLSESKIADIKHESEIHRMDTKLDNWQKGIKKVEIGRQILKSAVEKGKQRNETEEWAKNQENIETVTEDTWYGEKIKGYKVKGSDKMYDWEDIYARKEQKDADFLAEAEVSSGDGSMSSLQDQTGGAGVTDWRDTYDQQMKDKQKVFAMSEEAGFKGQMVGGKDESTFYDYGSKLGHDWESDDWLQKDNPFNALDWTKILQSTQPKDK